MKVKFLTMGVVLVVAAFMSFSVASASTTTQAAKKSKSASSAKPAKTSGQAAASSDKTMAGKKQAGKGAKPVHRRRRPRGYGVPKGAAACVDRLIAMAEKDPLVEYEKGPYEIINNGLLWNNPHSNCSVGDNADLRAKVFDLSTAWQQKDAGKVRSSLQEIKSALPPAPEKKMIHKTRKHHKAAKSGAKKAAAEKKPSGK